MVPSACPEPPQSLLLTVSEGLHAGSNVRLFVCPSVCLSVTLELLRRMCMIAVCVDKTHDSLMQLQCIGKLVNTCSPADRPVAKNFQVGVLSLRVLGPGKSEARMSRERWGYWGGVYPSLQARGQGSAVSSPAGSKNELGAPGRNRIFCILALKSCIWWHLFTDFPESNYATDHSVAPRS